MLLSIELNKLFNIVMRQRGRLTSEVNNFGAVKAERLVALSPSSLFFRWLLAMPQSTFANRYDRVAFDEELNGRSSRQEKCRSTLFHG